MSFIEIEKCLKNKDFCNSRFKLTNVAAKRAGDLIQQKAIALVEEGRFAKATTTALEEIMLGKITIVPQTKI